MSEDAKPQLAPSNQDGRSHDMTREGFTLLIMGWDDKKSVKFKMTYIEAFEAMLAALKEHQPYVVLSFTAPELTLARPKALILRPCYSREKRRALKCDFG